MIKDDEQKCTRKPTDPLTVNLESPEWNRGFLDARRGHMLVVKHGHEYVQGWLTGKFTDRPGSLMRH